MIANAVEHLGAGIPNVVREEGTKRITDIGTGPPRAHAQGQPPAAPPLPSTWPEILDLAGRAAASGVRQWMLDAKTDPVGPRPPPSRGSILSVIAFVLSVIAIVGVVASVLAHQLGSASYEVQQAEANQAFREELAAQRESIADQREAIYLLIDVLCVNDPRVCAVERKLQR